MVTEADPKIDYVAGNAHRARPIGLGRVPAGHPARSVRRVISLGANTRNGGPQNPVPRLV